MTGSRRRQTTKLLAAALLAMTAAGAAACGSDRRADEAGKEAAKGAASETAKEAAVAKAMTAEGTTKPAAPATPVPAPATAADPAASPPAAKATTSPIPAEARQLIIAVTANWEAIPAELSRWERKGDGAWQVVGKPWTGVVGSGTGWGRGRHGEGPPAGQSGPQKQEGDGRAPAGVFALNGAYGYAKKPPADTRWSYTPVDKSWYCVDDSASKVYGTIVDADEVAKDWSSAETMKRRDALYTWVVDVAHNPFHAAKAGSCIFLHVWRAEGSPTVGCTAMPKPELEAVLTWLDPAAHPTYVLLPRQAYAELAAGWGLPAR